MKNRNDKTGKNNHIILKIIGEGPLKKSLENLTKKLKLEKQIEFLGSLKHDDVLKELSKADLFILNSLYEGLPHVVIEAMLCDCPVIATDIPGTCEIAVNKQTALLCQAKNPLDLSEKIKKMLNDEELQKRLCRNAKLFIQENFNWKHTLKELEKIFNPD